MSFEASNKKPILIILIRVIQHLTLQSQRQHQRYKKSQRPQLK